MSKVLNMLRRGKKQIALVAVVAAAIIVPATLYAWGPTDRPTFTADSPADHITFNSITDNPDYGDERNFVRIKDAANTSAGGWSDTLKAEPGKEYLVQMYVHNNAASSLNLTATNTRVKANIPTATSKQVQIDGFISADNATPKEVWDQAIFTGDTDFNLAYVAGSATMYNNVFPTGTPVSDGIATSAGAPVGYDKMDGNLPGCFKYSGYVSFRVKPQFTGKVDFTIEKSVSKHNENKWVNDYKAQPGETVDYLIEYKNTGTTQQDNVVIKDKLPAGMEYVNGSTKFGTKEKPEGQQASDNITKDGINIGSYAPGASTWAMFSAKTPTQDNLKCGANNLKNVARIEIDEGYQEDDANVTVDKECQEQPEYKCTALAVSKLSDTKFKFETGYSVKGGTFKSVSYAVSNEAGQVVATVAGTPNAAEYTQATPGKYRVQATVTFTVDGKDVTADGEACAKTFEVPTPEVKQIEVCDLETKKIITIKESDFDSSKHSKDLNDCKETTPGDIIVCDLTTNKVITIKEDQFNANKHSKDLNDCKTPAENCPIPGKEHMPKNSPDCIVTPTELPQTGASDSILSVVGLAAFALLAGYAVTGRRTLG